MLSLCVMQTAPEEQASSSAVLHAMSICHIAASSYEQACTASHSALAQLSIDTVLLPPSATAHCSNDTLQSTLGCALLRCGRADLAAVEFDAVAERLQASHTSSSSASTSSKKSTNSGSVGSTVSDKLSTAAVAAVDMLRAQYHCGEARRQKGDWRGALQLLEAASAAAVELLTSAQVRKGMLRSCCCQRLQYTLIRSMCNLSRLSSAWFCVTKQVQMSYVLLITTVLKDNCYCVCMQAPEATVHRSRAPTVASVLLEIQSALGMCLLQRAASDSSSSSNSSSSSGDAKTDVEAALLAFEEGLTAINGDPTIPHLQLVGNASLRVSSSSNTLSV
jgi:hypothetical protein